MKYQQPYGAASDAPYVNGNPAAGIEGSIPPAAAIEHPQREMIDLITRSGLAPTDADLTQVSRAVRSQRLNYLSGANVGGAANALTLTLSPAPSSWAELVGAPLRVMIAATNTAAATLAITGLAGTVNIVRASGDASRAGDLTAGAIVDLIYDGANVQIHGLRTSALPTENVIPFTSAGVFTFTVPAGVTKLKRIRVWGAGAGGGGMGNAGIGGGGGGGGGGYAEAFNVAVTPGQTISGVVGAGGVAGAVGGNNGGNGQTTSFGAIVSATGGTGGTGYASGTGLGGAGGAPSGGQIGDVGAAGQNGVQVGSIYLGGQGGSAPNGGSSTYNAAGTGPNGNAPGGGAAGGAQNYGGGTGAVGRVIVEY